MQRALTIIRGIIKRYGPSVVKKRLWDTEFSSTHWDFIDNTVGDCVYPYLERYVGKGSILDLGCGPGNTATELAPTYQTYVGVDISEAALAKASKRTQASGRERQNRFAQGDFLTYTPTQQFDVILFREAMYHVPQSKVKDMLDRYAKFLKEGGVFIVRMVTGTQDGKIKRRLKAMTDVMESEFDVVEKNHHGKARAMVIVFRPKRPS